MGKIIIMAKNIFEEASGTIRSEASHIINQSGGRMIQHGEQGIGYYDEKDRQPPTDIRITKVEGPFITHEKLVDEIEVSKSYIFKATPTRIPNIAEVAMLKWAVKFDENRKQIIGGIAFSNKLEDGKITIAFKIHQDFEKATIYAFYQKPTDDVSVNLKLRGNFCYEIPPKYPVDYGSCNYYKWRFENFLARHKHCSHLPPKYYFGPMKTNSEVPYFGEDIDAVTNWWSSSINTDPLKPPYPQYNKGTPLVRESYGYKYCMVFSNNLMPRLSKGGQKWLKKARENLQDYMDQGLINETYQSKYNEGFNEKEVVKTLKDVELNENWFQEFAFATHPDAYLDAGLLYISIEDKIEVSLTPDFKEWGSLATWEQAMYVAQEQVIKWKNDTSDYATAQYLKAKKYFEKKQRELEKETAALQQETEKLLKEVESWF